MTKDEFIEKYKLKGAFYNDTYGTLSIYARNEEFVNAGDVIGDLSGRKIHSPATGYVKWGLRNGGYVNSDPDRIVDVEDMGAIRLWDLKQKEYERLVNEHRKSGDLIDWWLKERDENFNVYHVIAAFATESEVEDYRSALDSHINVLFEEHEKKGELEDWLWNLKKNDILRYRYVFSYFNDYFLKEKYQKEITEHRNNGDLIDYLWDLSEKLDFNLYDLYEDCSFQKEKGVCALRPFEILIKNLLKVEEMEELEKLHEVVSCFGTEYEEDLFGDDIPPYVRKLAKYPQDSVEYKRYEKIKSRITKAKYLENFDKIEKKKLVSVKIIVEIIVATVIFAAFCVLAIKLFRG